MTNFTKAKYDKLVNAPLKRKFKLESLKTAVRNDMTPADVRKKLDFKSSKLFKELGIKNVNISPSSQLLKRSTTLGKAAKLILRRTGLGKGIAAATVVAGAYEAGKRKLFTKEGWKKGKKEFGVDKKTLLKNKKSIGGETVVMKSGGGYIDDLL